MWRLLLLFAFCACAPNLLAQSKPIVEFTEYDLDNGLHIILQADHSRPVIALTALYRVGSKDENPQRTGFAHLFEHLLVFGGSTHLDRGGFVQRIRAVSGDCNASTDFDETRYYERLPPNQLELGLWLEAERMTNAKIDSMELAVQRLNVRNEKAYKYSHPYGGIPEVVQRAAFSGSPYEWLPIGSMEDLDRASVDEFEAFYRKFYVPENAVLCIVGDIEIDHARELIAKYFAGISRGSVSITRSTWKEIHSEHEVRDTVYENINMPMLVQAYRIPGMGHPDELALRVLGSVLGENEDARLGKTLFGHRKRASYLNVVAYIYQNAGLLHIEARPSEGGSLMDLEKRIDKAVDNLKRRLLSEEEIQGVKKRAEAGLLASYYTSGDITAWLLARSYVYYASTGHVHRQLEQLRAVMPEDVRRVADKYLKENNRITIWGLPEPTSGHAGSGFK